MAIFPIPIGIERMLCDIATGIGTAGQLLPELSRSEVGALAVKSAAVEIAFELSAEARTEKGQTTVGVRSFLFGVGTGSQTTEQTAHNTGRIRLEIVAIIEPTEEERRKETPNPPRDLDPVRLRLTIGKMRQALPELGLPEENRNQVEALIDTAAAALDAGDLAAASDIIAQLASGFAALGRAIDVPDGERG